ncbi:MAG TPA: hypothetical protein VG501_07950 [Rhizomicrobium sp.]|nr:hypothetical protein [Rhizomicrobium sp.]HWC63540.1 hypothetical protein [Rhizomicrobium sp.]
MTKAEQYFLVDEIWRQRLMIADRLNARRYRDYRARRAQAWFDDTVAPKWDGSGFVARSPSPFRA